MKDTYDRKQIPLLHRLPMTRIKLLGARILHRFLHLVLRSDQRRIRRQGINYQIDLSEGIDLSLFLFGDFQSHVAHPKRVSMQGDSVILDIGANIGVIALSYAQSFPHGRVYAFEPTVYAYQRFLINLSLNPELANRVVPIQAFMSSKVTTDCKLVAYSSWKVNGTASEAHALHGGTPQPAGLAPVMTVDDFCRREQLRQIDLIKIDTDGHELEILFGARDTLGRHLPYIIFEAGLYLMDENSVAFEQYYSYLKSFGYSLLNTRNGHIIKLENYLREIPLRSTTDILAIPPSRA